MQALLDGGLPVASSCSGDGVCAKCKVQVLEGMENLSSENETESFLRESKNLPQDQRVSCQVEVLGDILISTTYW